MFDLVHKYKKFMVVIIFLIALSFVFWGVENRVVHGGREAVATVNGLEISVREFEDALRRQHEQLRQVFGGRIDPSLLDTPESRRALLDSLIDQRLVASAAAQANLTVTDEALRDAILGIPAFQGPDGQFSRAAYETILRQQNPPLSPSQFEAQMRLDLAVSQLARAVSGAAIPSRTVAQRLAAIEAQAREIAELHLPAAQFASRVQVSEEQAKAYYDANQAQFRTPERVRADYVLLSAEAMAAQETVKPEEVRAEWERAFGAQIREREAARERAQALAAEVRKAPARFAEVARRESQDPGSKETGGDLGFAPRGAFVKPFEDAVFRMREGEISNVVESEFGFHIIQLTGIRKVDGREERRASHILVTAPMDGADFEEMRPKIEAELRRLRVARRFLDAAESFNNLAWEQPESLDPLVERFKLKVQRSGWITRGGPEEPTALDEPRMIAALFSTSALERKRNTDAIEVAPDTLAVARVAEHQPAAQLSFDDVRSSIIEHLRRQEAAALARKEGEARLERLRAGEDNLKWSATKKVSRREPLGLPDQVLRPVMSADVSKLPAYVGVPLGDEGYLLLRISRVADADLKAEAEDSVSRAAQLMGAGQYQAFLESLRAQARIRVNERNLARK